MDIINQWGIRADTMGRYHDPVRLSALFSQSTFARVQRRESAGIRQVNSELDREVAQLVYTRPTPCRSYAVLGFRTSIASYEGVLGIGNVAAG